MAKVALICLYDDWTLGLRLLSNALISNGNEVSIINFKLPSCKELDDFLRYPSHYENVHSNESRTRMILKGYGIDVNMWTPNEIGLLRDLLKEIQPEIIGLSSRSIYEEYAYVNQIMEIMAEAHSVVTVAGGFGATFNPERYLQILDYACIGEGEDVIIKMAECVDNSKVEAIKEISNLVYRENGKAVYNKLEAPSDAEDYWFNPSMDKVKRYVIENNMLQQGTTFIKNILDKDPSYGGFYYTMAGRGCLWDCSFCSTGKFYEKYHEHGVLIKKRRLRSVENVIKELKYVKEEFGFKKIFFMDPYFSGPPPYLMEFFKLYKREINVPFFAQFYPPQVLNNSEILKLAHEAGLIHTVVGLQAGSEYIAQEVMNRKEPIKKIIEFARMICQYDNISLDYHLITHNPFEKEEHINENFDILAKLPKKNSQLVLQRLRPFPTSKIAKMIKEANLDPVKNMERDRVNFILYLIRFYSSDEIFERIKAQVNHYCVDELKEIYSSIRKEYDLKFTLDSWVYSGDPILIQEHRGFNIVIYKRKILALSQSLGSLDLSLIEENKLKKYQHQKRCFIGDSIEEIKDLIDRANIDR